MADTKATILNLNREDAIGQVTLTSQSEIPDADCRFPKNRHKD